MKKKLMALCSSLPILYSLFLLPCASLAQSVGIGTTSPDPSAQLDIRNTSKGLLIPRMTTSAINSIASPARGLMVYDSVKNQLMVNMGTATVKNWQTIVFNSGWSLAGNTSTNPASFFVGTTDNNPLRFRINNKYSGEIDSVFAKTFWGYQAGSNSSSGYGNVGIGYKSLRSNTTGSNNTAVGDSSLFSNTTSSYNTASGAHALFSNTTGYENTAHGYQTLYSNTSGFRNMANGNAALHSNTTGNDNTGAGCETLYSNTIGNANTANGLQALYSNTTGNSNTANGVQALYSNITGTANTANGVEALYRNTAGTYNTAIGQSALFSNSGSLGNYNTAVGAFALGATTGSQFNTAVGYLAGAGYDLGYNNTILGANSTGSFAGQFNMVAIGQGTVCPDNSTVRIGNNATWSIGGYANWSNISDGRFKKDVKEDVKGLDFIMKLRPVTYHLDATNLSKNIKENQGKEWNEQMKNALIEKEKVVFSGFVAQEVEQAAKEVNYNFSGVDKPRNENGLYGLRYAEFVVPLVKAVQEVSNQNTELKKQLEDLQKRIQKLESSVTKN